MGSSKKVTVGYKYYLGMHMVLCHGPIDFISQFRVDNRIAWRGFSAGGEVNVNKPGLFGGEDREGGVAGKVDVLMGEPTQTRNSYLRARLGDDIPAFRGVVSTVLKQVYLGLNPYLKPWSFRAQRVNVKGDGEEQWYPNKAPIGSISDVALYLTLDISNSMSELMGNGNSRLENAKLALESAFSPLLGLPDNSSVDIMIVGFADSATSITKRGASGQDIQEIIDWINGLDYNDVSNGSTDFMMAFSQAETFFNNSGDKKRISIFISDGLPSKNPDFPPPYEQNAIDAGSLVNGISGLESYGINIDLEDTTYTAYIDNTPRDGIPVVTGSNESIQNAVTSAMSAQFDLNPSHIIRECLTDKSWGMGYLDSDVDDATFQAAADTLFEEGMGMSLVWDRQMEIQEFINEVIRHIDATLYVDRVTGKFVLKLIRDDYNIEELITLGPKNIQKVSEYGRIDPGNSVNSVTVIYWDYKTGEDASVSADDISLIQSYGNVINTSVQYPGFTNPRIAGRAALRDLQALSFPLLNTTFDADRTASGLNIGDTFKFEWPRNHDGYVIMRVNQISFGDGRKNRVKIVASEDVFALPNNGAMAEEENEWVEPGGPPLPPPTQIVEEATYFEMVQEFGQSQVDSFLADDNEVGYLQVAASRPTDGINAQAWVDDGSGYSNEGSLDFSPHATLSGDVDRTEKVWDIENFEDLDQVEIGTHAQIGEELLRVDAIDEETGQITVGRAILDTIPSVHSAGSQIVFWDSYAFSNLTEYVLGETLDVRILTNSSQGTLDLTSGTTSSITMDQRAIRPFRPAALSAYGELDPNPELYPSYPVQLSWNHRSRVQETSGVFLSWEEESITPESGTDYRVLIEALDEMFIPQGTVVETLTSGNPSYLLEESTVGVTWSGFPYLKATITTVVNGVDSWKSPSLIFRGPFQAVERLGAAYREDQGPQNVILKIV